MTKKAIIIGAGPAGLTAAYELLKRTDIIPIVLEKSEYIGGISRTIDYKGNRMDMGPHRFFSKSDRVMDWWLKIMPLEAQAEESATIHYQNKSLRLDTTKNADAEGTDKKMILIKRLTRIYFLRKFFAYPIHLTLDTLKTLGLKRTIGIIISYLWIRLFPRKEEKTLEDFIINKFGKQLYLLFFKDYTEKVWGVPCEQIPAEWGAQRIKGVSLSKAVAQAVKSLAKKKGGDLGQKSTETSLIEQFLYPKYGPGSLWEEVARQVEAMGGQIYLNQDVQKIEVNKGVIDAIHTIDSQTGQNRVWEGDYFFSTMPVLELIAGMGSQVPEEVQAIAAGLQYRDFINVGVLLKQFSVPGKKTGEYNQIELKDNWIYIQERDVKVGRLMIYNNWGDGMVNDLTTTWIGMEYFCNKTDDFWALDDGDIQRYAIIELEKMALARASDVLDITVCRMEKTYPAYFGAYEHFDKIRAYTDRFPELFLVGRNGMHKYNNADHSMLTAMVAVDNIATGIGSKENIWAINTEQEYHEEKKETQPTPAPSSTSSIPKREEESVATFFQHIWKDKRNRAYCILALAVYLLQFIIFKFQYPFANYMPDSYSYLEAAASNADVNMWPVAYSKFLRLVSVFIHSDKALVGIQYLFMQGAGLVFLFTLLHLLRPGRLVKNTLYIFFLINPIALYVANYISADALFIGFSLLWVSSLTWVVFQPRPWMVLVHGILILACFTLRYNAIYYPFISIVAFSLSPQPWKVRLVGIGLGIVMICGSIWYTSTKMKETSGKFQFSAFGGWQLANNALYMYEHIPAAQRQTPPARFAKLELMVRQHIDTLKKVKFSHEDSVNTFFYLWSGRGPLVQYLEREYKKDSTTPYFKRWASEGPLYMDYAKYLISSYPVSFFANFMLPNAVKFAVPPPEFLGTYNMGEDSVGAAAKQWFQYKSLKVRDHNKNNAILSFTGGYSIFAVLVSLLFLIHIVGLLIFNIMKTQSAPAKKWLLLILSFWLLNAGFSIFASPIVLRYQVFPILVGCCAALVCGGWIYQQQPKNSSI
jgi:protoporphyrinogen oxidase